MSDDRRVADRAIDALRNAVVEINAGTDRADLFDELFSAVIRYNAAVKTAIIVDAKIGLSENDLRAEEFALRELISRVDALKSRRKM